MVSSLSSTDQDSGDTHSYALVSGDGDTDNTLFKVKGNEIYVNSLDENIKESYSVRIQTEDSGGLKSQTVMVFTVSDFNVLEGISAASS